MLLAFFFLFGTRSLANRNNAVTAAAASVVAAAAAADVGFHVKNGECLTVNLKTSCGGIDSERGTYCTVDFYSNHPNLKCRITAAHTKRKPLIDQVDS